MLAELHSRTRYEMSYGSDLSWVASSREKAIETAQKYIADYPDFCGYVICLSERKPDTISIEEPAELISLDHKGNEIHLVTLEEIKEQYRELMSILQGIDTEEKLYGLMENGTIYSAHTWGTKEGKLGIFSVTYKNLVNVDFEPGTEPWFTVECYSIPTALYIDDVTISELNEELYEEGKIEDW